MSNMELKDNQNLAVLIIDLDKLGGKEFSALFTKAGFYVAKIKPKSYKKVTDVVDKISDDDIESD